MRRETAEGESYLGLKIFRFYFRCPNCLAEITFKTDIENVDYQAEHGATRLFDSFKYHQEQEKNREEEEEAEKQDAMKMLEKRTKMSRIEMEALGQIEELQEANRRMEKVDALDYLSGRDFSLAEQLRIQEEKDEAEVRRLCGKSSLTGKYERRIIDDEYSEHDRVIIKDEIFKVPHLNRGTTAITTSTSDGQMEPNYNYSAISSSNNKESTKDISSEPGPSSGFFKTIAATAKKPTLQTPKFLAGVIVKKKPK